MNSEIKNKLRRLAKDYARYGVTYDDCIILYNSSLALGMSPESAVVGLRMNFSERFNAHEYFTSEDIAAVTGRTVEEVNRHIEENKEELLKNGHIVEVSSPFFPK